MSHLVLKMISLVNTFLVLVSITSANEFKPIEDKINCEAKAKDIMFNKNHTGVYFDPYVILQDQSDSNYYNESGLTVLLRKVNTKFNHIMIGFTDNDDYYKPCPLLVARAAAKINKKMANPKTKLLLTIRFTSDFEFNYEDIPDLESNYYETGPPEISKFTRRILKLKRTLDKANSIYPGTIHKIIYQPYFRPFGNPASGYTLFRKVFQNDSNSTYKFGLNVAIETCASRHANYDDAFFKLPLDTIIYSSIPEYFDTTPIEATTEALLQKFESCKLSWEKALSDKDKPIQFITSWWDTDIKASVRFNNSVYFWSKVDNWARETNTLVFIFSAFDTFHGVGLHPGKRRSGWWRVVPNSSYVHPSQFIFEKKSCLSNPRRLSPEMINMSDLEEPLIFHKNVGTYFQISPLNEYIHKINPCGMACLRHLLDLLFSSFSTLLVGEDGESTIEITQAIAHNNRLGGRKTELILFVESTNVKEISDTAHKTNSIYNKTINSLVYPMSNFVNAHGFDGLFANTGLNLRHIKRAKDEYKLSLNLAVIIRAEFLLDTDHFKKLVEVGVFNLTNIVFVDAPAHPNDLKQDINQLLLQYTAMFEVCVKLVRSQKMQVGIITGWPEVAMEGLEEVFQFVRFWQGINSWMEDKDFKVIMNRGLDHPMHTDYSSRNGWWRFIENGIIPNSADLLQYMNKREIALKLANDWLKSLRKADKPWNFFESWEIILVLLLATALTIILTFIVAYLKLRKMGNLMEEFVKGSGKEIIGIGLDESIAEFNWSYDKSLYEIAKDDFSIKKDVTLGSGQFGMVFKGSVEKDGVIVKAAVKMTKAGFSEIALKGALSEIKVMTYVGNHSNVVEMIGAYTSELKRRKLFIFLEMCELGSLVNYLRTENAKELTPNLFRWSYEISNGMEYIASKRIVHLDLATRNVLLTSDKVAKISDFGLSRRLHNYDLYAKKRHEPLPWRWMSIEALRKLEFSEKSDVWAFGITLWEIFSLGDIPYKWENKWSPQFLTNLEQGVRLKRPVYCEEDDNDLFPLIQSCWDENRDKRPTFSFIKNELIHFA